MRRRRAVAVFIMSTMALVFLGAAITTSIQTEHQSSSIPDTATQSQVNHSDDRFTKAQDLLEQIDVKGRASKTGYTRTQFGSGWAKVNGCSTRDIILYRDLTETTLDDQCKVKSGTLSDPYTGKKIIFTSENSAAVQIDHVVALSNAWQTGAQQLTKQQRIQLANDPLELIAVDGPANQQKGDSDAATWLPKNKLFRCEYIERQVKIKQKYNLWVTPTEKEAMEGILRQC